MKKQTLFAVLSSTFLLTGCGGMWAIHDEIDKQASVDTTKFTSKQPKKPNADALGKKRIEDEIDELYKQMEVPQVIIAVQRSTSDPDAVEGYDYDPKTEYYIYTKRLYAENGRLSNADKSKLKDAVYRKDSQGITVNSSILKREDRILEMPAYMTDKQTAMRIMDMARKHPSNVYHITAKEETKDQDKCQQEDDDPGILMADGTFVNKCGDPLPDTVEDEDYYTYLTLDHIEVYDDKNPQRILEKIKSLKKEYVKKYGTKH